MIYYLTLLGTLITLLYLHLTRNFNYWKNKNVKFVKPIPFFGNMLKFATQKVSIDELLKEIYNNTEAPFIGFFLFDQPALLIRNLDLIRRCLIKDFEHFSDRSITENRKDDEVGSNMLFLLKNPLWRSVRVRFTEVFSTGRIKNMFIHMLAVSKDLRDYINKVSLKEEITDVRETAIKFTTELIASCAFGVRSACFLSNNTPFHKASRQLLEWELGRKLSMASYFFAPFLVKLLKLKFLEPNAVQFFSKFVLEDMKFRKDSNVFKGDVIDSLIELKKNKKPGKYTFDANMIVAQAIQFFIAGVETTASTILYALYELSFHPTIQDRLRNEIKITIEQQGGLTYESIQNMTYLGMVLKETLRKYPILPYLDRRCTKAYKIPGTNAVIEKGIPIYISVSSIHTNPDYYPNPEVFDPERFTPENMATRPPHCFLAFGAGPHICIGTRFGNLGAKIALITIIKEFEVVPCKETLINMRPDPANFIIAPQNGIKLCFRRKQ